MLSEQVHQASRLCVFAPVVSLKDMVCGISSAEGQTNQRLVYLLFAFEVTDPQFILMQIRPVDFDFLCSESKKLVRAVEVSPMLGHLSVDRITWEQVKRDRRLLNQLQNLLGIAGGLLQTGQFEPDSSEKNQSHSAFGRYSQFGEVFQRRGCQGARFPEPSNKKMNLRAVQLQRSRPIQVVLPFKNLLGFAKHLERFVTLLVVGQSNADESQRFRLLIAHGELLETPGCPLGQCERVAGKVQLKIDLGFIQIA